MSEIIFEGDLPELEYIGGGAALPIGFKWKDIDARPINGIVHNFRGKKVRISIEEVKS